MSEIEGTPGCLGVFVFAAGGGVVCCCLIWLFFGVFVLGGSCVVFGFCFREIQHRPDSACGFGGGLSFLFSV